MILLSDGRCWIANKSYPALPLVLDRRGEVIEPISDYLRVLAVHRGKAPSSVYEYAKKLRSWWYYLSSRKVDWKVASDYLLIAFRNDLLARGTSKQVANDYIGQIFGFYVWAQERGLIQALVAPAEPLQGCRYRISSSSSRDRRGVVRLKSTLLFKTVRKPFRHTPTDTEITRLHQVSAGFRHAVRNTLIMSWAEFAGLRRAEVLSLVVSMIPSWDQIDRHEAEEKTFTLSVTGKGRKTRKIAVPPSLMALTRDYIELDRRKLLAKCHERFGGRAPDAIFLTERGAALAEGSLSNLWTCTFRRAGVRDASGHRLRAVFLTRLVEAFSRSDATRADHIDSQSILLRAAEAAGHNHPSSLQPYLHSAMKNRIATEKGEYKRALEQDIALLERRRDVLKAEFSRKNLSREKTR
jgi:integrase